MRNVIVTHASNVISWCGRTILSNAEQCAIAQRLHWRSRLMWNHPNDPIQTVYSKSYCEIWTCRKKKDQKSNHTIELILPHLFLLQKEKKCFLTLREMLSCVFCMKREILSIYCYSRAVRELLIVGHIHNTRKRNIIYFQHVKENFQNHIVWKLAIYFSYLVPPFGPNPASSIKLMVLIRP